MRARRFRARAVLRDDGCRTRRAPAKQRAAECGTVVGAVIAFGEGDAGSHVQQVADGSRAGSGAGQAGDVIGGRFVDRADGALGYGDAEQHGGDRLGHGLREQAITVRAAVLVVLEQDGVVVRDQQSGDGIAREVVGQRVSGAAEIIGERQFVWRACAAPTGVRISQPCERQTSGRNASSCRPCDAAAAAAMAGRSGSLPPGRRRPRRDRSGRTPGAASANAGMMPRSDQSTARTNRRRNGACGYVFTAMHACGRCAHIPRTDAGTIGGPLLRRCSLWPTGVSVARRHGHHGSFVAAWHTGKVPPRLSVVLRPCSVLKNQQRRPHRLPVHNLRSSCRRGSNAITLTVRARRLAARERTWDRTPSATGRHRMIEQTWTSPRRPARWRRSSAIPNAAARTPPCSC